MSKEPLAEGRNSSRYDAIQSAIYLGWWEEPEYRTIAAVLKNVSQGGAMVQLGILPPEGVSLWLCLAGAPPGEWIEVEPVASERRMDGSFTLHLKFHDDCPYEMFHAAAFGLGREG